MREVVIRSREELKEFLESMEEGTVITIGIADEGRKEDADGRTEGRD